MHPLGTVTIDSPLLPPAVIENIRARGKDWPESAIPDDLRKFKVRSLAVEIDGSQFEIRWVGNISPLYNPVCFGIVEPYGDGSRIRGGFKLQGRLLSFLYYVATAAIVAFLISQLDRDWQIFTAIIAVLLFIAAINGRREPKRAALIEVLTTAARA